MQLPLPPVPAEAAFFSERKHVEFTAHVRNAPQATTIDGVVFWLFVSPLIFLGGYVWGLIMSRFFETRRKQWGSVGNDDA